MCFLYIRVASMGDIHSSVKPIMTGAVGSYLDISLRTEKRGEEPSQWD